MSSKLQVVLAAALFPFSAGLAQTVSGSVVEQTSGLPVRGVGVVLFDPAGRPRMAALSDSLGTYRMSAPSAGVYRLTFRRVGLNPLEDIEATLRVGFEAVVNAALSRSVTTLTTVSVVGKRVVDSPPGNPRKYDEFLRRKAIGLGTFLTTEDLESRPRHQIQEVFNGIPGIKVRHNGTEWHLQSQRCSGRSIPGLGGQSAGPDPKLKPAVFLEGVRMLDISALSELSPSQVAAVEIYQGAAEMPAEARGDACFAVFVWLK